MASVDENIKGFDISDYMVTSNVIADLNTHNNWWSDLLKVAVLPFLLFDVLFAIVSIMFFSYSQVPAIINVILFSPLIVMVFLDYVLPYIRGN